MADNSPIQTLIDIGCHLIEDEEYASSVAQAQPVVYGVMESHDYPCPEGYGDDYHLFATTDSAYESPLDPYEALLDYLDGSDELSDEKPQLERALDVAHAALMTVPDTTEDEHGLIRRVKAFVKVHPKQSADILEELGLATRYRYQLIQSLHKGAIALTHAGIERYLEADRHNCAADAHSFAMTATRCDEYARLVEALRALAHDTSTRVGICPKCQKETTFDLEIVENDDDVNIFKVCTCHECGTTWTETYTHVHTDCEVDHE